MSRLIRLGLALPLLVAAGVLGATNAGVAVAQGPQTVTRLVIADAVTGVLTVLDASDGKVLATFGTPSANPNVVASASGRWVYAVNTAANRVTILDTGLRTEDHGDHADLVAGPPFIRGTIVTGRRPIDFWADNGKATVHNDDDGTLAVFDEERLEIGLDFTEIRGAGTGHNNAVVLDGTVLLSLASVGQVTAYQMDNAVMTRFEGCPGTHGWTTRGMLAAAGCTDGVLLITKSGAQLQAHKIAEPAGGPESARVSTLTSHPNNPMLIGNFGQGLALIDPSADVLQAVPLPANPVKLLFDETGTRLVVLTLDGVLRVLDPTTRRELGSVPTVTAGRSGDGAPPAASFAVGHGKAYVTDPQAGQLVEVDLGSISVARRISLGGAPRAIALVSVTGVVD